MLWQQGGVLGLYALYKPYVMMMCLCVQTDVGNTDIRDLQSRGWKILCMKVCMVFMIFVSFLLVMHAKTNEPMNNSNE